MSQFELLVRLTTQSLDTAAGLMREAQQRQEGQKSRLAQLDEFIGDYRVRLLEQGGRGMGVEQWLDFRTFLGKLDDARATQQLEVDRATQRYLLAREAWLAERKKLKAYQVLLERQQARQALKAQRAEQKLVDEFAMRKHREKDGSGV
ncbi:flagellar export protein FliJ [Craterilacuibacter sp. RT1T]|uniref:flagellar export protein FliJ n=1 Tax=Craterilacuibacter sp. RT1T TaxID=2942211 RepID=UPI0020C16D8B|nr:flagellar export protein FliJ [Craterilacuibacter sp. RT1T]MCL6264688.1 flagellar export protein FliJ [Craterilacuibacter sp. RT1T]